MKLKNCTSRHCEPRSGEAISKSGIASSCFPLRFARGRSPRNDGRGDFFNGLKFKYFIKKIYLASRRALLGLCVRPAAIREVMAGSVASILVIRIDRIGDVIVSLPAIRALKETFPGARITVLVKEEIAPLLKNIPWIDEVASYRGLVSSIRVLRRNKFSMAVDLLMDYPILPAVIAFFSGAGLRAGFDMEGKGRLFNLTLEPSPEKKHVTGYMLDLIRKIASLAHIDASVIRDTEPELSLSAGDRDFAGKFFRDNGVGKDDIVIGLHPGGRYPSQRWMPERFGAVAAWIGEKYNARIIIVGSRAETGLINKVSSSLPARPIIAAGLPLNRLASLIEKMDLFICNNSGPWHIACALKVPTVSTMGPTNYFLWRPGKGGHIVVRKAVPCTPCDLAVCARHDCMKMISVEDMMEAIAKQVERIKNGKNK